MPNRFEYGYGLTPEIVAVALQREPDLLVTVDNGISSVDGVAAAKAAGLRVLVTDHHLPGHELPAADAIVNPNQPECTFPSKCIAGVGVIFYVLLALRARLRDLGWFARQGWPEPNRPSCSIWWRWAVSPTWCRWTPTTAFWSTRAWREFVRGGLGRGCGRFSRLPGAIIGASPPPTWASSSAAIERGRSAG